MAAQKPLSYTENDIEYHEGLMGVRKKPTPYIGPPDSDGIGVICREPLDNVVDEAGAGRATKAHFIDDGEYFWVQDDGLGIPVKPHPKWKISTLELVVSRLHAGGKMSESSAYKSSIGTHGIGIKATNALSAYFQIWTFRDGKWWTTVYQKGVLTKKVASCQAPILPTIKGLAFQKPTKGTIIKFKPDPTIFAKGSKLQYEHLFSWSLLAAYFNPGLQITVSRFDGKQKHYYSKSGISEYLTKKIDAMPGVTRVGKMFLLSSESADLAVQFTDCDGSNLEAYTNGLRNRDGGHHVSAFLRALNKAIAPYKKSNHKFTQDDLYEGLVGVVNVKLASPQFNNQPKDKLIDSRVPDLCDDQFEKALVQFFAQNKALAAKLCQRATELKKLKDEFRSSKKALKELSGRNKGKLPVKLARADCPVGQRELFIVEGDSAGGTAKRARLPNQEVLPIRGKILNTMKARPSQAFSSEGIMDILRAIGYDPAARDPFADIRVGKVCLLSDPDPDGSHINLLEATMFVKILEPLIHKGVLHVVVAPEYTATVNGQRIYGDTLDDIRKQAKGDTPKDTLHIKGWGEVKEPLLRELAFNPATRRLIRLTHDKSNAPEFSLLMSDNPAYRASLLGVTQA